MAYPRSGWRLAAEHQAEARVFGSLAWQALTGLDYLTGSSDLDLLLHVRDDVDVQRLIAELAEIEAGAPMRLDGELVRADGAAANWREFHAGAAEILVKTTAEVTLVTRERFLWRACRHDRRSAAMAAVPRVRGLVNPDGRSIAADAERALLLELETWPKPGLVSHVDRGSHDDMDAAMFRVSAAAIEPYFRSLAEAGARGCGWGG